jgi:anti-sigma factor RsiW
VKCADARRFLSPYLSSELDETTEFEIARHMEICEACAARFCAEEALERAIRSALQRGEGDEERVFDAALGRVFGDSHRFRRVALLLWACAAVLAVSLAVWAFRTRREAPVVPPFVVAAAADHRGPGHADRGLDVEGSPSAVEGFLDDAFGASLGGLRLGPGWAMEGVRRCRLDGVDLALVRLSCGGQPVSLFVPGEDAVERWEGARGLPRGCSSFRVGNLHAVVWIDESGVRLAVGDVEPDRLRGLYEGAPGERVEASPH